MMFIQLNDVHEWLENESGDRRFYMKLLGLNWRIDLQTEIRYLAVLKKLADKLQSYSPIVCDLILHNDWRIQLIGNAVAINQQNSDFEEILVQRLLKRTSWVAPQLAAGFALLTSGQYIHRLENYLIGIEKHAERGVFVRYPKKVLSVYSALNLLNNEVAKTFATKPFFPELQAGDRDSCIRRVENYYNYWKKIQTPETI